jgi:hypothetical protein
MNQADFQLPQGCCIAISRTPAMLLTIGASKHGVLSSWPQPLAVLLLLLLPPCSSFSHLWQSTVIPVKHEPLQYDLVLLVTGSYRKPSVLLLLQVC